MNFTCEHMEHADEVTGEIGETSFCSKDFGDPGGHTGCSLGPDACLRWASWGAEATAKDEA